MTPGSSTKCGSLSGLVVCYTEGMSRPLVESMSMPFQLDDGGRTEAGFKGTTGDCACRAAAIVTGLPYREVYDAINVLAMDERPRGRKRRSGARTGVWPQTIGKFLEAHGFCWVPTMQIGQGCTVHLREDELPGGRLVVRLSKHYAAVLYGTLHDLSDCSRDGTRCVYGYWVEV